jgi:hypothetical protein
MTTPSVSDIAAALTTALGAIPGLRTAAYLQDTITPPVALVAIERVNYHGAFAGGDVTHTYTVHLILDRNSDRAALAALEGYMSQAGATSVRAAIESDVTLGGVVAAATVTEAGPVSTLSINGTAAYVWLPFTVEVHA